MLQDFAPHFDKSIVKVFGAKRVPISGTLEGMKTEAVTRAIAARTIESL
jgi:hypothetical protein